MKKFAFGASKFFLGSVFGLRFCIVSCFLRNVHTPKSRHFCSQTSLCFCSASPFLCCFCPLTACNRSSFRGIVRPYRPMCSYTVCVCFYFPHSSIFPITFISKPVGTRAPYRNARNLMHKQSVDIRYFSNYPNNLLYFFFELFVFKLNKYFSIFSDTQQALCVITVNCALNTLSCLLVYKTAAQLTRSYTLFSAFFSRYSALGFPRGTSSATQTL